MKLCEILVHIGKYNFTKFHQNQMKNKKVLLIAHFSVQNFKVSVELWKLYIVYWWLYINSTYVINRSHWAQVFNGGPLGCPSGLGLVIGAFTDLKPVTSEKKPEKKSKSIKKCVLMWL